MGTKWEQKIVSRKARQFAEQGLLANRSNDRITTSRRESAHERFPRWAMTDSRKKAGVPFVYIDRKHQIPKTNLGSTDYYRIESLDEILKLL